MSIKTSFCELIYKCGIIRWSNFSKCICCYINVIRINCLDNIVIELKKGQLFVYKLCGLVGLKYSFHVNEPTC